MKFLNYKMYCLNSLLYIALGISLTYCSPKNFTPSSTESQFDNGTDELKSFNLQSSFTQKNIQKPHYFKQKNKRAKNKLNTQSFAERSQEKVSVKTTCSQAGYDFNSYTQIEITENNTKKYYYCAGLSDPSKDFQWQNWSYSQDENPGADNSTFGVNGCTLNSKTRVARSSERTNITTHITEKCIGGKWVNNTGLLYYSNGDLMKTAYTSAIFWGPEWKNTLFVDDKKKGIEQFLKTLGTSQFTKIIFEFLTPTNNGIDYLKFTGSVMDSAAAPKASVIPEPQIIIDEACKMTNNNPDPNTIYLVFTSTFPSNVDYCGWHQAGHCSGGSQKPIYVSYIPNLDGVASCDVGDIGKSSGHSPGLTSMVSVTSHEIFESVTDPDTIYGWRSYDGVNENGDLCAWVFPSAQDGLTEFSDGSSWLVQTEWSNQAKKLALGASYLEGCINKPIETKTVSAKKSVQAESFTIYKGATGAESVQISNEVRGVVLTNKISKVIFNDVYFNYFIFNNEQTIEIRNPESYEKIAQVVLGETLIFADGSYIVKKSIDNFGNPELILSRILN